MKELRPFEDLIKPIEYQGETFIPIEEIAKLAMSDVDNSNAEIVEKSISKFGSAECRINRSFYDCETNNYCFYITDSFNAFCTDYGEPMSIFNQVQIVKNLIKWGFVEP